MPSPDFWAEVVTATLLAHKKKSMSKSKLRKRAVAEAKSRLPDAKKSFLVEELTQLLSADGHPDMKIDGDRISLTKKGKDKAAAGKRKPEEQPSSPPTKKQAVGDGATAAKAVPTALEDAGEPSEGITPEKGKEREGQMPAEAASGSKKKARTPKSQFELEIMPGISEMGWRESRARTDVKTGRFSKAERDTLKQAAVTYAQERGLSDTDFGWLYETRKGPQRKLTIGAWKVIAESLPHRKVSAVWRTGTRILHPDNYKGKWSEEETARLCELVSEVGRKWVKIGQELHRMPWDCRDRHREVTSCDQGGRNTGRWTPEESAALQDAVEAYMQAQQEEEGKLQADLSMEDLPQSSAGGSQRASARLVLDDIDWNRVAAKVGTRGRLQCMNRWYRCMAPSMVTRGDWGVGDDRRLLKGLLLCGATEEFRVPWDALVPGRSEKQTKRRWRLMLKCIPGSTEKDFTEQLDYLVDVYTPGLRAKLGLEPGC